MAKFPRPTDPLPGLQGQPQQSETQMRQQQQQALGQNSNIDNLHANGMPNANNVLKSGTATSSANTIVGLLHQNSVNSRQQNPMSGGNGTYGGNSIQMPSPGSSNAMLQPQPSVSPFQSPTPSSSNNPQQSHVGMSGRAHMNSNSSNISMQLQQGLDPDANDSQSSVQKILHEMMMSSSQIGGGGMMGMGTMVNDARNVNGMLSSSYNGLLRNGVANGNPGFGGTGLGISGNGLGHSTMVNGTRLPPGNNSMTTNGRVGTTMARELSMNQPQPQQDLGNQLLGPGAVNGFNDIQFDWKPSS